MILINGEVNKEISATDRGLHYGDGLFETIACINGKPRLWPAHMARLQRGCEVLGLPQPDTEQLYHEVCSLCRDQARAVVKLIYTRGSGGRGYRPPHVMVPQRLLLSYPWPDYSDSAGGIRLRLCDTPLACNPVLAGIKHLNRLEQVMARAEWDDATTHEGLMCDLDGWVKEGTMSNLFWVSGDTLHTPDLSRCGVAGVMRDQVMVEAGRIGIEVKLAEIEAEGLVQVDEIFMTNSLVGIWPVAEYAGHRFAAGRVTARLQAALQQSLESFE